MKTIKFSLLFFLSLLVFNSCQDFDADLDPQYTANPTPEATANEATALSAFQFWYNNANEYNGPGLMLATMADMHSCSWGNQGMRDMSSEPRKAWDNNPGYSNAVASEKYYTSMYTLLANQTLVIQALESGLLETEQPAKVEALARFGQAAAIGYIALLYDRVWIVDETGTLFNGEAGTPAQAIDVALNKLDRAIELCNSNSFTVEEINGLSLTSAQFAQFLNTFSARILVNSVRNSTQRDALDWTKVQGYANNGLTYDFKVLNDGGFNWYSLWQYYATLWARTDMRVVHLMDPNTTDYFTEPSGFLPPATSTDARLLTDFQYKDSQDFIPSRGIYHFSNYRHKRYDTEILSNGGLTGNLPEMLKAENDLYKAEAHLRLNQLTQAANVINGSTRVTRGNLPAVAATAPALEAAIHYERSVELMTTGLGLGFYEMRKQNLLQTGTPLHLPVPGAYLLAGGFERYTFGGTTGVAGQDYSPSGWR